MSEKQRTVHNTYCDYQIAKAKSPSRIYSVRDTQKKKLGIRTSGLSKAMLVRQLASLF